MKNIIISILIILSLNLKAQDYFPIPEQNAVWTVTDDFPMPTFSFQSILVTQGDTSINNQTYVKIYEHCYDVFENTTDTISRLYVLFRQDIEEKKVFVIRLYMNETDEKLLYQFDLEVDQQISLPGLSRFYNPEDSLFVLEQITQTTLFDGTIRNIYKYRSINYDQILYNVIEGIGSKFNPFGPNIVLFYSEFILRHLSCFSENSELQYLDGNPNLCGQIISGLNYNITSKLLKTYPNPAKMQITFELPSITNVNILQIKDLFGKTIAELPLYKERTELIWECSSVSNGVYFYQTEINGEVYRGKIIVQH